MKMKKLTSLLLASVMVLSMLAGCGNKADAPNSEPPASNPPASQPADDNKEPAPAGKEYDGVTLTMWSMWSSGEPQANVISEAAAAFEEKTGAKVNIEFKGRDVNKVLAASLEAKDNIDIIEDDYKRIGTVYQDFTMDLTDMAKAAGYEEFSYQCFTDQSIAWCGFLNAITEQPNVGGIFYDKDAFEKAGITAEPKTWAEFLDVCQKLKDAGVTGIEVVHAPVSEIPKDCQIVVTHHELANRAVASNPNARVIPIKNFMGAPEYEVLVKEMAEGRGVSGAFYRYFLIVHINMPLIQPVHTRDDLHQCRLSRAVGAEKSQNFSLSNSKSDPLQHFVLKKRFVYILQQKRIPFLIYHSGHPTFLPSVK